MMITVILMTTLPYLYASRNTGDGYSFAGFLVNPIDGNSYLAKMYEGWRGEWKFTLPYTAEKGYGAYLFLFYLSLGHFGRVIDVSLLSIFHTARVVATLLMLLSLYRFLRFTMPSVRMRIVAFGLIAFGSGLGWIALLFNTFTSDFWVAEIYPFLSAFTNPHFPFGLAILLHLLTYEVDTRRPSSWNAWLITLEAFVLAIVMPFGVVIGLMILLILAIWENYPDLRSISKSGVGMRIPYICLGGLPYLLYAYLATITDPLLSIWNSQNYTPTPPIWDVVVSLSPALILAILAIPSILKDSSRGGRVLLIWAVLGFLLIYFPWGLQRRLMTGLYVPVGSMAVIGISFISKSKRGFILLSIMLFILIIPTNIVLLLATRQGVDMKDNQLYLSVGEVNAMAWLEKNTQQDDVILAAPETGLFLPAHTGRRVIYGHPYETVDSTMERSVLTNYFQGGLEDSTFYLLERADYIFSGPRESELGEGYVPPNGSIVYQNSEVILYRLNR